MSTLRLLMHVLLAGTHVFLTSLTLLVQWSSSDFTWTGAVVVLLLGAWAGASSTLRTRESLIVAAVGVGVLSLLVLHGHSFSFGVNLWVLLVMVPLSTAVWLSVAWRWWCEDGVTPLPDPLPRGGEGGRQR